MVSQFAFCCCDEGHGKNAFGDNGFTWLTDLGQRGSAMEGKGRNPEAGTDAECGGVLLTDLLCPAAQCAVFYNAA